MTGRGVDRLRHGVAPLLLYPLLALLSFPTLSQVLFGDRGLAYAHDVFDMFADHWISRTGRAKCRITAMMTRSTSMNG